MSNKNIITQIKEAAERHKDNVAVVKLMEKLELATLIASTGFSGDTITNPLAGYERTLKGDDGFHLMINPPKALFDTLHKQAFYVHEASVVADCLMSVLMTLGESF